MQKTILFIAAFLALCSFSPASSGQNDATVMKVAQDNLQSFLTQIPPGQLEGFGFNSRGEFASSTIGKPYQMLGLNLDIYKGIQVNDESAIIVQDQWRVPVVVNGQQRLLLSVSGKNGSMETVGMGGAGLATELQKKGDLANANQQFYLLRIYPLEADFFVSATGSSFTDAKFFPLYSATMAMPVLNEYNTTSLSLSQVLPIIKDALKNQQKN